MKKILIISISSIIILIIGLLTFYFINLKPTTNLKEKQDIIFTISSGMTTKQIAIALKEKKLIKNANVFLVYTKFNKIIPKSGPYMISTTEGVKLIAKKINNGETFELEYKLTFIEGKTLKNYAEQMSPKLGLSENDILKELANKNYLNSLIEKYWFITDDILDEKIYFPLEGYLFPDTYIFRSDATIKTIVGKMLDNTEKKLKPFKSKILNEELNVHDILTMASMVEKEANTENDRLLVAGVFYNRIKKHITLGSDVTTYYAEQIEMGSVIDLYQTQYDAVNAYNTRAKTMYGLPIGPICNPSLSSIEAAINPKDTDYLFFYADTKGRVHFTKTDAEHEAIRRQYK